MIGLCHGFMDRLPDRAAYFQRAEKTDPQHLHLVLANIYSTLEQEVWRDQEKKKVLRGQKLAEVEAFISANIGAPTVAIAHCLRCSLLIDGGRLEEALEAAETACLLQPAYVSALQNQAYVIRTKNVEKALGILKVAQEISPGDWKVAALKSTILLESFRIAEADAEIKKVLQLNPAALEFHRLKMLTSSLLSVK